MDNGTQGEWNGKRQAEITIYIYIHIYIYHISYAIFPYFMIALVAGDFLDRLRRPGWQLKRMCLAGFASGRDEGLMRAWFCLPSDGFDLDAGVMWGSSSFL
jgi:hypothetical protein